MEVITVIIILLFLPPIQEHYNWIKPVGIRPSVADFDVDYGAGLSFP